jgi:hypothetical protein
MQHRAHHGDGIRGDGVAVWNRRRLIGRPRGRARCPDCLGKRGECPGQVLVGAASVRMSQPDGVSALGLPG